MTPCFVAAVVMFAAGCSTDPGQPTAATPGPTTAVESTASGQATTSERAQATTSAGAGAETDVESVGAGGTGTRIVRTDHAASGNRLIDGFGRLDRPAIEFTTASEPAWLLMTEVDLGVLIVVDVDVDGSASATQIALGEVNPLGPIGVVDPGRPVELVVTSGDIAVRNQQIPDVLSDVNLLPDGTIVEVGDVVVALADPTGRYAHGVLGDAIEADAVAIGSSDRAASVAIADGRVVEGRSALLADVDGDGTEDIVVTTSGSEDGGRVDVLDLEGATMAASEPIGRSNRWRHQIGVADFDGTGPLIVDVRTPHLTGELELLRFESGSLVPVSRLQGYGSHRISSPNLDQAAIVDADGDGRLDIVTPRLGHSELAVVAVVDGQLREQSVTPLGSILSTNLASAPRSDGTVALAVGMADNRIMVWP